MLCPQKVKKLYVETFIAFFGILYQWLFDTNLKSNQKVQHKSNLPHIFLKVNVL
jgi:hypothetical protein